MLADMVTVGPKVVTFTVNGTYKDDLVSIPRQQSEMLNLAEIRCGKTI